MSNLSKTKKIQNKLLSLLKEEFGDNYFLIYEVEKFIKSLNRRKISTLEKNFESFINYMKDLEKQFLSNQEEQNIEEENNNLKFRTSQNLIKLENENNLETVEQIENLNTLKWYFWLTVVEFTQWRNSNFVLKYRTLIDKNLKKITDKKNNKNKQ